MSETQLYRMARRHVDQKNRRWLWWGVDLFAFLIYAGVFFGYPDIPHNAGDFILKVWFGLLILHTVRLVMVQERDEAIESEVVRLRGIAYEYEKPKRRALNSNGEAADWFDNAPKERVHHR